MNPEVLICSSLYDFSTDLVCVELDRIGVDYLRLNREHFKDYRISLDPLNPNITINVEECTYDVGPELKSIWFRQPVFLRNTPADPLSTSQQLERSQWTAFLRGLCVFDQVAWMNFPARTYLAESKPYQLYAASKCGFAVPKTCVSNDSFEIQNQFPEVAAIKSLDTVLVRDGDESLFTYTNVSNTSTICAETTRHAPMIAQKLLRNKIDLRVTVVGDKLFGVRVLAYGEGIEGDWRLVEDDTIQYEDVELSENLHLMCLELLKKLGLSFGAIDLVESHDQMYFIEVNPTGEWGWLNGASRPIAAAIALWLAQPTMSLG